MNWSNHLAVDKKVNICNHISLSGAKSRTLIYLILRDQVAWPDNVDSSPLQY